MSVSTNGIIIGDSIVNQMTLGSANNAVLHAGGSTYTSIATAGDTIANQYTKWLASSARGQNVYDWCFIMCGINDILHGDRTATQIHDDMATLRSDILAQNPRVASHLYLCAMLPCRIKLDQVTQSGGPDRYALWQTANADYISSFSARTTLRDAINDGTDNLILADSNADRLHPNSAGDLLDCQGLRGMIDADFPDPPPSPPPPFAPNRWQRFRVRGAW